MEKNKEKKRAAEMAIRKKGVLCKSIEDESNKTRRAKETYTKYGTSRYTSSGISDRISALPPRISLRDVIKTGDEQSYYYGYYERGTEKLATLIKYPEIKRIATIEEIGYNDAVSGIAFNLLPEAIQSSKEYLEGYKKGLEELKTNKKTR